MAIRKEIGDRVLVIAGKSYNLKESLKDMFSSDSPGLEDLIASVVDEAKGELKEGETVEDVETGSVGMNLALHFYVVLKARKYGSPGNSTAS